MKDYNSSVYANDLIERNNKCMAKFKEIKSKLKDDYLINQGLFIMSNALFEATLRDIMFMILLDNPTKLVEKTYNITKKELCNDNDNKILQKIIDKELFSVFQGSAEKQLLNIINIVTNIAARTIIKEKKEIYNLVKKCSDISYYRNILIHNSGNINDAFREKVQIYTVPSPQANIIYSKELIIKFTNNHSEFLDILNKNIHKSFRLKTRLNGLETLWYKCFSSPMLKFNDYWELDKEHDLITAILYPSFENNISSGEKVILSIWRHQYDQNILTNEFMLYSLDSKSINTIGVLYNGLKGAEFFYMKQQASRKITRKNKISSNE